MNHQIDKSINIKTEKEEEKKKLLKGMRACVRVWGIIYCLDLIYYFINAAYNLYAVVDWVFWF